MEPRTAPLQLSGLRGIDFGDGEHSTTKGRPTTGTDSTSQRCCIAVGDGWLPSLFGPASIRAG